MLHSWKMKINVRSRNCRSIQRVPRVVIYLAQRKRHDSADQRYDACWMHTRERGSSSVGASVNIRLMQLMRGLPIRLPDQRLTLNRRGYKV